MTGMWDDPYGAPEREFKHGPWSGMPPRHIWNSSPNQAHSQTCIECGYRWGETDFSYRAHPSRPVELHQICWNCWMIDNQPETVQAHWAQVDSGKVKTKESKGGFKSLGDGAR